MRVGRIKGRNHHIIIVAEGYGSAQEVADQIHEATGIDTRVTILGHIQRGRFPHSAGSCYGNPHGICGSTRA
mgnify:CR=1 FL=1